MKHLVNYFGLVSILNPSVLGLDNGFGRTPVLGYNTYNDVACSPNSNQVKAALHALKDKGLLNLGYKYFQVDCGWQGYERSSNGSLTYDSARFPDGIKPLSDLARSLGFAWSMYTDQGVYSCDTATDRLRPGSLNYEKQDAAMFAIWNTEYVKVDNCYIEPGQNAPKDPRTDYPKRYGAMSSALQNVSIKGMLICQWGAPYQSPNDGLQGPSAWTPALANSYRVSDDIAQGWANVQRIMNQAIHVNLKGLSGPGHFADLDLLEVGNPGMTLDEQKTHFAIWSTFKSAIMISTNPSKMSAETLAILSNKDLIAVNQDALGTPIKLVQRFTDDFDLFVGPLANGDQVVLVVDQSNRARTLKVNFQDIGISSASVKNLWTGATSNSVTSYGQSVPAHGSLALRLSKIQSMTAKPPTIRWYEAEAAAFAGGAGSRPCSGCSGGSKAGFVGRGSSLAITGVTASTETSTLRFDYINCEIGYLGDQRPNVRTTGVSINGGPVQKVSFPLTGYNWDTDLLKNHLVRLSGFKPGSKNVINITAVEGDGTSFFAPDFDRIGLVSA